ncbi:MAG: S9 family peptidase [Bdellovibrionota bacterium]
MRVIGVHLWLFLSIISVLSAETPPPQKPLKIERHGDERDDPYFWLRESSNPEVLEFLEAENQNTEERLRPLRALQRQLIKEMKLRIEEAEETDAVFIDPYYYYTRYKKDSEYPIYCRRRKLPRAKEEIYLDVNALAQGHDYFEIGALHVSPDHQWVAYSVDTKGSKIYDIHVRKIDSSDLSEKAPVISDVSDDFIWANDSQTLFFIKMDADSLRPFQVLRKNVFDDKPATLVFQEDSQNFWVSLSKSKTNQFIFIESYSTLSNEIYFLNANEPQSSFQSFHPREKRFIYNLLDGGNEFFIHTNWGAKNFRILTAPHSPTLKADWKEIIPHNSETFIESLDVFENFFVLEERQNALSQLRIVSRERPNSSFLIEYNDPAYVLSLYDNPNFHTNIIRYSYESMTTPLSIYSINMNSKRTRLLGRDHIGGNYQSDRYESQRLMARARDGSLIPISIVYKKKARSKNQARPLLLYAYGAYGDSVEPHFRPDIISLLDRDFIFAIAHVRGGSEFGPSWYDEGKMFKKMNSFHDYIDAAEFLIREGYTTNKKLYGLGESAGGLLMGAVMNMRPDLFRALILEVPFLDVLTTMLDKNIPLTTHEYDEWGNPHYSSQYFYMKSYSPYDNIRPQAYPHLFFTAGFHDTQVPYWEPAKCVAKLRQLKKDSKPILFYTDMIAGHSGKTGRFKSLIDTARLYSFLIGLERGILK